MSDAPTPPEGERRRLHPSSPLLDVVTFGRQALLPLIFLAVRNPVLAVPVGLVGAAVIVGLRYLAWSRHTYRVEAGSLVVEKGVLNRERKAVPVDRVQQVDLQRKLRHRALGLAVVRIDTAGGGNRAEVVLDAVSDAEAERLRHVLGARDAVAPPAPTGPGGQPAMPWNVPVEVPGAEPERVLVEVPTPRLALAGVTGSKLLVVVAVLGSLYGFAADASGWTGAEPGDLGVEASRPAPLVLAFLALAGLVLWLASAAGAAVLADAGFRLSRRGDRLHVRRGLLDQREATLLVHRIQAVRVLDNPLRRALRMVSVTLQSAGGAGSVEGEDSRVTVPLLRRSEVDALLAEVLPGASLAAPLQAAPPAARRRAWFRHLVPAAIAVVPAVLLARAGEPAALLLLLGVPLAVLLAETAYRALGWARPGGHLVARRGAVVRETVLVPVAKVQSTRLVASVFQRRVGLASLLVDVAGRGRTPAVVDGAAADLAPLRHGALLTGGARRDELAVRRRAAAAAEGEVPA